ncbi:acetolactate decarboxylase [Terriglobus roseus]|uniref:Alpha-acetolactate decarboxylase n=1 Tax=Terriglobus roseus TaxID=392734 RepID=A0A1H4J1J0_9BACT|nr:acetolactate decarboxylase [Terriglobus roseus]SEB39498.1 acetolactate decarboxylase [Terriglobus roseus]
MDASKVAWRRIAGDTASGELYQTSLITALLQGVYDGEMEFVEVMRHGDFGLGTFNGLDGEMVAAEGEFYQLHSDGTATPVRPDQKTPFAAVTHFVPQQELRVTATVSRNDLLPIIAWAAQKNLFTAVQIEGLFQEVRTRTVAKQTRPYPPLTEAAGDDAENIVRLTKGTLVGFLSPDYAQGFQVAGFHLHFLSEDKTVGGHMLDFIAQDVTIRISPIHRLHVELPTSVAFLNAEMNGSDVNRAIQQAEG